MKSSSLKKRPFLISLSGSMWGHWPCPWGGPGEASSPLGWGRQGQVKGQSELTPLKIPEVADLTQDTGGLLSSLLSSPSHCLPGPLLVWLPGGAAPRLNSHLSVMGCTPTSEPSSSQLLPEAAESAIKQGCAGLWERKQIQPSSTNTLQ